MFPHFFYTSPHIKPQKHKLTLQLLKPYNTMASKIPNKNHSTYRFDRNLKEIYFRVDTKDTYNIVLVPETLTLKEFPSRSIIIKCNIPIRQQLCSMKPGECVKLIKVKHRQPFFSNQHIITLFSFQTIRGVQPTPDKMVEFITQEQFKAGVESNKDPKIVYYVITEQT